MYIYIYMNYTWVNTIISEIGLDVCGGFPYDRYANMSVIINVEVAKDDIHRSYVRV